MRLKRNVYRVLVGKPKERPLGRPRLGGRIILKCILQKWDGVLWAEYIGLRTGTSGRLF
jgi:hypothetical protein